MASLTPPLLHGFINNTHTSNITSYYPPQNLPTPWPLVAASIVLSLVLSCYGIKGAFLSWTGRDKDRRHGLTPGLRQTWLQTFRERRVNYRAGIGRPLKGKRSAHPVVHESELEDLHWPDAAHAHHGLNDDTITSYEQEDHSIDLKYKLDQDDEDDITYHAKAEDDDLSKQKQKHDLDDENFAYQVKRFDDDVASKHTATDPFGESEAATLRESMLEVPKSPKWVATPFKKGIMTAICAYCLFRAIVGLTIAILGLINHATPPPAPSLLLLSLISIQIYISNRSLPRLLTLIHTIAVVLTALALLTVAYAPLSSALPASAPAYGQLSVTGGRCPVPASDCHAQTKHWTVVGCANYTYYHDLEDADDDEIPTAQFYPPYATQSDVNVGGNALHVVETVVFVFGTLWLLTVLLHVYEARKLLVGPGVASNLLRPQLVAPQRGKGSVGAACTGVATMLGIMGAVVAAVMSLAAHVSQATGTPGHGVTYLDSAGLGTWANFTRDGRGEVTATRYWGNETVWNDCFSVVSPTLGTGWGPWATQNGGWEWVRILVAL